MLRITDTIAIQDWELTEQFVRSSSPSLPGPVKTRLKRLAGRRWTQTGALVIQCDETRSQARNREIARDRLAELIRKALEKPKPRIATKPTKGSVRRRLDAKTRRGEVKSLRGTVKPGSQSE